jgi:hypothetical protein
MSIEAFELFVKDKTSIAAEDDARLYRLAVAVGITPPVIVRILYLLWKRDRSPVSILDHGEKR